MRVEMQQYFNMSRDPLRKNFWRRFPLDELSKPEWEALCDGCGKCCVLKLEDEDTAEVRYTNVACRLFDSATCRCGNYLLRKQMVSGCVVLTPENIERNAHWMPTTCAYRLLQEGEPLPDWHPLISGDPDSVHDTDVSMRDKVLSEYEVEEEELEDYVIEGLQ